jgi:2-succinyl-6-hydroxy-2,4-cyclohexadiene-1-carboxylate synthase
VSTPLLLLHGFTGSPDSWAEMRRHMTTRDILAPPLLGHDGTPGRTDVRTFDQEVDRLAGVALTAGQDRPHIVGYSMGGRVALGLLIRHPRLFRGATLIGASPGLGDEPERQARARRDEEWARLLEDEGLPTFVAAWEALPFWGSQEAVPATSLGHQRLIRLSHDALGLARALRVIGLGSMPDFRPALGAIDAPVRLVVGERDRKFVALAREMADLLPAAELRTVADAGHNVVLERPTEIVRMLEESEP